MFLLAIVIKDCVSSAFGVPPREGPCVLNCVATQAKCRVFAAWAFFIVPVYLTGLQVKTYGTMAEMVKIMAKYKSLFKPRKQIRVKQMWYSQTSRFHCVRVCVFRL